MLDQNNCESNVKYNIDFMSAFQNHSSKKRSYFEQINISKRKIIHLKINS